MSYNILIKATHLSGKLNIIPDLLSRGQVQLALQKAPNLEEKPTLIPSELKINKLLGLWEIYWIIQYQILLLRFTKEEWVLFQHCLVVTNQNRVKVEDLPLSFQTVLVFLTYLRIRGFAPATITTYVSAIGYIHKINGFEDPTSRFIVQKTLASINRLYSSSDSRLPITQFILFRLLQAMDKVITLPYHIALIRAMLAVAFYGLLRIGEISRQKNGVVCINLNQA